jgi:hypothetical protein
MSPTTEERQFIHPNVALAIGLCRIALDKRDCSRLLQSMSGYALHDAGQSPWGNWRLDERWRIFKLFYINEMRMLCSIGAAFDCGH